MPKSLNQISYGKISLTSDTSIADLKTVLGQILKDYGYPESKGSVGMEEIDAAEKKFQQEMSKMQHDGSEIQSTARPKTRTIQQTQSM